MKQPPWRRPRPAQFPGVPAWGAPAETALAQTYEVSGLGEVTPDWAWGDGDGSGVRACVVDSGIDEALVGVVDRAVTVVSDPGGGLGISEVPPGDRRDPAGHGTACAGIIRSLAPAVSLTSVRVLTDGVFGQGTALLAGLRWAIEEGYDVINLSLSTTKANYLTELHELADTAYFRRSILVAAAHNMPVHSFPWTFSSVISVACHDEPNPMNHYYNPVPPVEFYARGVRVMVPWAGGGQRCVTGNSFATPHLSGICCRILSKHPWLTPSQLKCILYLTARNTTTRRNHGSR